ncbi:MAG: DUF308 domain-containing protein [Chloroflexota bacterium]|jgi:uncharacterized membrane protein HdeD (DUF308 family)|nr:DUF308 domain-containing protein [Chloroflexota bacterium]
MTSDVLPVQHQRGAPWWLLLLQGIAALLVGLLLLAAPLGSTVFIIQFLGWYWLIGGIFSIVGIFLDNANWGWKLVSGLLGILAGFAVVNHPLWATVLVPTTLVWVMGFFGIFIGVSMLIQAFQGEGVGAGILGALNIILGLLLLMRPFAAALSLPWVFAVFAIAGGISSIVMAFRLK